MLADSQSYLSKKNTDCLKGIFAGVVVLAHIRGRLPVFNDTVVGQILTASGYLAVAVFFFSVFVASGNPTAVEQAEELK